MVAGDNAARKATAEWHFAWKTKSKPQIAAGPQIAAATMPAGMTNICVDVRDSAAIQHGLGVISICSGSLHHTVWTLSE
jgi:hypothetical protein